MVSPQALCPYRVNMQVITGAESEQSMKAYNRQTSRLTEATAWGLHLFGKITENLAPVTEGAPVSAALYGMRAWRHLQSDLKIYQKLLHLYTYGR